ncbi:MAG: AAA family ATPase [Bacillota bacterium]
MKGKNKLTAADLICKCESSNLDFETTADIKPFSDGIIGQNRAVEAVDLGLKVEQKGYNIYMSGDTGTGKSTYAKKVAEDKSKDYQVPPDLCYVYNFKNSEEPKSLKLPPGYGIKLKNDIEEVIEELKEEIPEAFSSEEYEEKKRDIMSGYQNKSNKMMEEFEKEIREKGFTLQNTAQGPMPIPLDNTGHPIKQEQFQKMDEEKRKELREKSQDIQNDMENVLNKIRDMKLDAQEKLKNEEKKIALSVIQPIIDNLKMKYEECEEILEYLDEVQEDIIENIDKFKNDDNQQNQAQPFPFMQRGDDESFFNRYEVNLLVSNEDREGAPVVFETNPNYYNLFGKIEGKGQFGTITTDFTMIKEGAVHRANGGFLIIKAKDVLSKPLAWETLKRTLINEEIKIENIGEQYRAMPIKTLKPEPISVNIKVIMIGNPLIYQLLYNYDEEFEKLFKIRADFDVEMKRNEENMEKFASFIASISDREKVKDFTAGAVSKVIEYSSRLTGDNQKMSTRFNEIIELLYESDALAADKEFVEREDVKRAIKEKEKRNNLAEEKIQEMIDRGHLLVEVKGEASGQINGLSVYQTGQYTFGKPSRITARTFLGQEGVINIEREVDMSGKIHNKGVMILSGYLGGKYAQEKPLSLSASIAFEQSYGPIDGDSASCAELMVLLSAISDIPLSQELAITGSMNQKGKVQPIGGVNEKIEGYFRTCKVQGLTGNQGVIIPAQNRDNLMLKEKVIEAVENDKFNIYIVEDIDEVIELMMEKPAAEVHEEVKKSLHSFASKAKEFKSKNTDKEDDEQEE